MIKTHALFDPVIVARMKAERERRAEFFNTTRDTIERAIAPDARTLAAAVIRAGKLRRGELVEAPPDLQELSPTAQAILNAAARARSDGSNEVPPPPPDSFAAKVILAGKKRRGEI
jgi:hypothetical protein